MPFWGASRCPFGVLPGGQEGCSSERASGPCALHTGCTGAGAEPGRPEGCSRLCCKSSAPVQAPVTGIWEGAEARPRLAGSPGRAAPASLPPLPPSPPPGPSRAVPSGAERRRASPIRTAGTERAPCAQGEPPGGVLPGAPGAQSPQSWGHRYALRGTRYHGDPRATGAGAHRGSGVPVCRGRHPEDTGIPRAPVPPGPRYCEDPRSRLGSEGSSAAKAGGRGYAVRETPGTPALVPPGLQSHLGWGSRRQQCTRVTEAGGHR